MSHVVESKLAVKDLDALAKVCDEMGLELMVGQRTHRWYGRFMNDWNDRERAAAMKGRDPKTFGHCEHAIRIKGNRDAYEIGLVAREDGQGWDAVYDMWGPGRALEEKCGKDLRGLAQNYATEVTVRRLKRDRFNVVLEKDALGRTHVKATRG